MATRYLIVVAVSLVMAADRPEDEAVKKHMKRLEGTWVVVSAEKDGQAVAAEKDARYTFRNDHLTIRRGKDTEEYGYRLGVAKKLKSFDLVLEPGSLKAANHGIYELDGDTLRLCFGPRQTGRPNSPAKGILC